MSLVYSLRLCGLHQRYEALAFAYYGILGVDTHVFFALYSKMPFAGIWVRLVVLHVATCSRLQPNGKHIFCHKMLSL